MKTYTEKDFTDIVDAEGNLSSVPSAWLKPEGRHLLPPGARKATDAAVRAAKAKADAKSGEGVDVDQIRADVEASVREEHEAALAERDERIAELEQLLEDATKAPEPGDGAKGGDPKK